MLSYDCDGVGSTRRIVYCTDAAKHVNEIAENIARFAEGLAEHFWEHVAASDLELLHEGFGDGEYPQDGWEYEEVVTLVRDIPTLAKYAFERSGSPGVQATRWYDQLVGFLNDEFPHNSVVRVNIEGPIRESLIELLAQETERYTKLHKSSDSMACWLGRLAVVSRWQ